MMWQIILVVSCILVEGLILGAHALLKKSSPNITMIIAMSAKIIKIALAAVTIFLVYRFTEIPILNFCIWLAVCYIIALIVETYILLKK